MRVHRMVTGGRTLCNSKAPARWIKHEEDTRVTCRKCRKALRQGIQLTMGVI